MKKTLLSLLLMGFLHQLSAQQKNNLQEEVHNKKEAFYDLHLDTLKLNVPSSSPKQSLPAFTFHLKNVDTLSWSMPVIVPNSAYKQEIPNGYLKPTYEQEMPNKIKPAHK